MSKQEGWLAKQSVWLQQWRRRYFRLVGTTLYWSKTPTDEPHGNVNLTDRVTVKACDEKIGKPNSIEVSIENGEVYYLVADTLAEKDAWIGAMGKVIVQNSRSYVKPGRYDNDDDEDDE